MSASAPRVALFADCFFETNGVARTCSQFADYARRREYPFFVAHAAARTGLRNEGAVTHFEFERSRVSLGLEFDFSFDLAFLRLRSRVNEELARFAPDLIHVTGPGDCGLLGAIAARELQAPLVASWHTNIHEYAARRFTVRANAPVLSLAMRFYRLARHIFAPNPDLAAMLCQRTGRPVTLMKRGIDANAFHPRHRTRRDGELVLGYVGRLSPEKNVRLLKQVETRLRLSGFENYSFLVVGDGGEKPWLQQHLNRAHLPGPLHGEALAEAYANMDIFLFPSETDTYGNAVQEAMASRLAPIVMKAGGPRFLVRDGVEGIVASGSGEFADAAVRLARNAELRERIRFAARHATLNRNWDTVFDGVYAEYAKLPLADASKNRRQAAAEQISCR